MRTKIIKYKYYVSSFLKDATGNEDGARDFSNAPVNFNYLPTSETAINSLQIIYNTRDVIDDKKYGDGFNLTNGITIWIKQNNVVKALNPIPIKKNQDWGVYTNNIKIWQLTGGDESLSVRWNFGEDTGKPIILDPLNNDEIWVTLNDDFTDLREFTFLIQGNKIN